ncbi:MAG: hypothetical protein FJ318_03910 [SAR202 cluster bacterium]|nr:hypothetical protein [SAR202 cluster bacterium]
MTLGNIGKPDAAQLGPKRKLLLVPFVVALDDDPSYRALVERYWQEAASQVRNLEASLGAVKHLFHEGTAVDSETEMRNLERGNPEGFGFVKELTIRGAALRPTEDPDTFLEAYDLQRCLMVARMSNKVMQQLYEWFEQARRRRFDAIGKRIDETLKESETGLLIITTDHQVQFPADIQVFYVAPPALNDIERWLKDHPTPTSGNAEDSF